MGNDQDNTNNQNIPQTENPLYVAREIPNATEQTTTPVAETPTETTQTAQTPPQNQTAEQAGIQVPTQTEVQTQTETANATPPVSAPPVNGKSKLLSVGLIFLLIAALIGGGYLYLQNLKTGEKETTVNEVQENVSPTLAEPTQAATGSGECVEYPEKLESCSQYTCEFTHPLTNELMTREISGLTDGVCNYTEEMPNSGQMDCKYSEDMRKAIAQAYRDIMKEGSFSINVSANLAEGTTNVVSTYTVDGKTVDNPGQEALDSGQCVISGY